jgi:hypothetical protein
MSSRTFFLRFCGETGVEVPEDVRDDGEDVDESEDADDEQECWPGEIILFGFDEDDESKSELYVFISVGVVVDVFLVFSVERDSALSFLPNGVVFDAFVAFTFASITVLGELKRLFMILFLYSKLLAKKSSNVCSFWHEFNLFNFLANSIDSG